MIENLLELRKEIKNRKPDFIRQDYKRRKRLGRKLKWRKPKGIHSKIRHHFKGRRKMPSPGYKSPKKASGLHASGLKMIMVFSADDVKKIKKENEGVIVPKSLGLKKRLEIFKKSKEFNVAVLNLNVDEHIKKIEEFINSKKKKIVIKKEHPKEKEAKAEQKAQLSEEQKKEAEDKEKHKALTKRQ